jgi:hypothetical protein
MPHVEETLFLDFGTLKKDGANICVTDENKHEYVTLCYLAAAGGVFPIIVCWMPIDMWSYIFKID